VRVRDNFFKPKRITINAGERVKWVNKGDETHTTTSKTGLWDKTIAPGEKAGKKFKKKGTYKYLCTIHDGMRGKVVVR
ncbi:MAG: cupredoxin domain-containing protein, partial [Actinomycetota bacterium]